jgi:hypothetical protein
MKIGLTTKKINMERSRYPPKAFITFLGVIFTSVVKPLPINNNYIADIYSINIEKQYLKLTVPNNQK